MENSKSSLDDLDTIFPEEWHNIPKPLIDAILLLKNCAKVQFHSLSGLATDHAEFELKINKNFMSVQAAAIESSEKVKNIDFAINESAKTIYNKFVAFRQDIENKAADNIQKQKILIEGKQADIKEQLNVLTRKVDNLITVSQAKELISHMIANSEVKALRDFKESYVIPEMASLEKKIMDLILYKLYRENSSRIELVENRFGHEVKLAMSKIVDLVHRYKELKQINEVNSGNNENRICSLHLKMQALSESANNKEKEIKEALEKINEMNEDIRKDLNEKKVHYDKSIKSIEETLKMFTEGNGLLNISLLANKSETASGILYLDNQLNVHLEEIKHHLAALKEEFNAKIEASKITIYKDVTSYFEASSCEQKKAFDKYVKVAQELEEKYAWLPINLNLLDGMSPLEARLFTVEARMRTEENARIKAFDQLQYLIKSVLPLSMTSPILEESSSHLSIAAEVPVFPNKNEEKKKNHSPVANELLKTTTSHERRLRSGSESVSGIRLKHNQISEIDRSLERLSKAKFNKRTQLFPKYIKLDLAKFPRIQTPSSQSTYVNTFKL